MGSPSLIAVVDDDEDVRISLETLIAGTGLSVALFPSAEDLLAHEGPAEFDCVVSDVQMPGMDGIQLASELRRRGEVPVILITAFGTAEVERRAAAAGVRRSFRKPYDPNALLDEIAAALDQPNGS